MNDPILITGAARSGTSMVAAAINICGAFAGNLQGPTKANHKGMYENLKVRDLIKFLLKQVSADPQCQYPLADTGKVQIPNDFADRVRKIFVDQGYINGPWMIKEPKLTWTWPVWNYAFPNAKWIVVRRRTGDIARSCCHTNFMRAFTRPDIQKVVGVDSEYEGWVWWVRQHEQEFRKMIETGLNIKVVWPERMVSGDYQQLFETMDWLGLKWNSEVLSFIDPKLWKSRRK